MKTRKICIVTGTRADYGHLFWLMKEIQADPGLKLQVVVTGMHLSPEFGSTHRVLSEDGFPIDGRVEMLLSSDSPVGVTKSLGLGVIGFADAFRRLRPEILVLLGDRFEILAAAQAALIAKIPVAHLHGGETSEGAIDEAIRHSITKMAAFHFVAAEPYRQRVIQLGEHPSRVWNVGAPGLDHLARTTLLPRKALEKDLGFPLAKTNFLVTYHPATLACEDPAEAFSAILDALGSFPDAHVFITRPNADTLGRPIIGMIDEYVSRNPGRAAGFASLGTVRYLSLMKLASAVVGNSSSGLIEAPALRVPTVNVGDRQKGRLKALSVIDCAPKTKAIRQAVARAVSPGFRTGWINAKPLYGTGNAAAKIKEKLKKVVLEGAAQKSFFDLADRRSGKE